MGAIGKFFDKHPLLACGALLVGLAALSASSDGEGEYCELTNGQKLDLSEALIPRGGTSTLDHLCKRRWQ